MMGWRSPRTSASAYQSPSRRAGVGSSREGARHECCGPCPIRSIRCRRDRRRGPGRDAGFHHHARDSTFDEPALELTAACAMRFARLPRRVGRLAEASWPASRRLRRHQRHTCRRAAAIASCSRARAGSRRPAPRLKAAASGSAPPPCAGSRWRRCRGRRRRPARCWRG